ncbi:Phage integrase family protein [Vibrio crassostreae]|nr:Phage integrase family protein [Vibrio chagasii]CAK1861750.1 Phage integrase family protein [Vibrio crassostreae]CAK1862123.1 Phage integrase family protein [Vibrio crassostreae]CAK2311287.1 Phage integrase family protein [Vibrio crassostreae]CAK2673647.1 Phage integrase family protein [Vibrio crassostreae]
MGRKSNIVNKSSMHAGQNQRESKLIYQALTPYYLRELIKKTRGKHEEIDGERVFKPYSHDEQIHIKDTSFDAGGLILRVSPRGKMTFVVHGRIKGQGGTSQYYMIGNAKEMELDSAKKQALKFKTWLQEGKDPREQLKNKTENFTLQQFHEEYLLSRGKRSRSSKSGIHDDTKKYYQKLFDRLDKKFITKDALKISREDVVKEHREVSKRSTPIMADKTFQHIAAIYRQAQKTHLDHEDVPKIKTNPVQVLADTYGWNENNGQSNRRTDCVDTEHLPQLLNAIEDLKNFRGEKFVHQDSQSAVVASHFFKFLLFTGWRPEEVCKMTWNQVQKDCSDVSWNDEQAAEKLKGAAKQYRAMLNSEAQKTLIDLKQYDFKGNYVFPNASCKGHFKQNPSHYINLLEQMAGTGHRYTAGIFRKTFQTYAEHLNINPDTIKRLVFHTQKHYSVQGGYIHSNRENFLRQSQKVADFILENAEREIVAKINEVEVEERFIHAACDFLKADNSKYKTVDEVLNHWLELGLRFDSLTV